MNRQKSSLSMGSILICFILAVLTIMMACAQPAPAPAPAQAPATAKAPSPAPAPSLAPSVALSPSPVSTAAPKTGPITLRVVTCYETTSADLYLFRNFLKTVNERAKGQLTLNWLGGPEVVPLANIPEAIRNGVIDIGTTPLTGIEKTVPEGSINQVSTQTYAEERKPGGLFDYFSGLIRDRMNLIYLGDGNKGNAQAICVNKPLKTLKDFSGLRIRTSGSDTQNTFVRSLGGVVTTMPLTELYSALQYKTLNGHFSGFSGFRLRKLWEVCGYFVDIPIVPGGGGSGIFVNMDKWNALPKNLQDLLQQVQIELEPDSFNFQVSDNKAARQTLIDNGMKPITFSPEENQAYINIADNAWWEASKKKCSPESYAKLKQILGKTD